jgi:hypothetical protein
MYLRTIFDNSLSFEDESPLELVAIEGKLKLLPADRVIVIDGVKLVGHKSG